MGAEKLGFNYIYKNVTPLQDTVQLTTNIGVVLISPDKTQRFALQKDEKLVRYFQDGDLTYIRLLIQASQFGWARLGRNVRTITLQGKERDNNINPVNQDETLGRVETKFKEVNKLL
jgi:hypothetical protein